MANDDGMNEDDSSRWEVPHYSHPEKDGSEECRAEKIVSSSRSSHTRPRFPFHILAEGSRTGSTRNATRRSKRSRNNASSTRNRAVDIVPDPVARDGSREAAAYYFHPSGRFGKLSFEVLR